MSIITINDIIEYIDIIINTLPFGAEVGDGFPSDVVPPPEPDPNVGAGILFPVHITSNVF